ncbi:hypothetical protein LVJ94_34930 [Pendulispora rubella]|uniref:Uncharacterized protein n=1 Tax=Pendulispora rubella TaxID=2741070 RepID=A0ABZ2KYK8_9BACT
MIPTLLSYLPLRDALCICKLAEDPRGKSGRGAALKSVLVPALGFMGGTGIGLGAGVLADKFHQRVTGAPIPAGVRRTLVPVLGTGLGVAYGMYKAREMEDMHRALAGDSDESKGEGRGG